jgi:hypothetical protein
MMEDIRIPKLTMEYKPIEKKYWTPEVKMKISAPGVICFSA